MNLHHHKGSNLYGFNFRSALESLVGVLRTNASVLYKFLGVLLLLFVLYSQGGVLLLKLSNVSAPSVQRTVMYTADYSKDSSYLGCVAEQLKCAYKNAQSEVRFEEFVVLCGEENYCASTYSTTTK